MTGTCKELVMWVVKIQNARSYLEIGVLHGDTFIDSAKLVSRAVGVDVRNMLPSGYEFYEMSSDEFFKKFNCKIDVIFIDGDHRFEQAKKDFENSLKILNAGGTIIIHDTDPSEAVRLSSPTSCADSYKLVDHIHNNHPELDILTFPVSVMGISVVRRKKDRRVFSLI